MSYKNTNYPFFPDTESIKLWEVKKKNNWFCSKPLSPAYSEVKSLEHQFNSGTNQKTSEEALETFKNIFVNSVLVTEKHTYGNENDSTCDLENENPESVKLWEVVKKINCFGNKPFSPAYSEIDSQEHQFNSESNQQRSGEAKVPMMYDSDGDLEYFPDSDESSDTEASETFENISENSILVTEKHTYENENDSTYDLEKENQVQLVSTNMQFKAVSPIQTVELIPGSDYNDDNQPVIGKIGRYKRNKDLCYFCETDVQNFARHMRRNHSSELEVQQVFSKSPKSAERRVLLALLKKKGNYLKNSTECVKPVKKALESDRTYLPCSKCLGFYRSKYLYRHRKKCCKGESTKHSQADGQNFLIRNISKIDQRLKEEVFPHMRADRISLEAKKDFLICAFGARYLKLHRDKHFINVVSRKMRELSRILLELKNIEPSINNLFQSLQPKFYDKFVEVTKIVAKYDSNKDVYISPTFAMNISTSLKQCCDIAIHMVTKNEASVETATYESNLKTMINLLKSNWRFDISNRAGNDLNTKKFNKITIVPLASDLKLLKEHLIAKAEEAISQLKHNSHNVIAYTTLLETIYCRVILLNRRRPGELQRMLLHTYENGEKTNESYEEFNEIISETERILLKNLKRVVIRGKRGRGVPVLFSTDMQTHMKQLLRVRMNFLGHGNPYLFGKPGSSTICGYKILAKYGKACGAKNPDAITCTRLRKHLATLTQLFNLNENELEQLSNFMGHTPGVHKSSYRLPDDVYQTAKISKLLILMENGGLKEHKGKSLDNIEINLEENLLNDINDESDNDQEENNEEDKFYNLESRENKEPVETVSIKKKKRILVPWTDEQKNVVSTYFAEYIKKKKAPKKKRMR